MAESGTIGLPEIVGMTSERDDLVAAIGRLRQGIQILNLARQDRQLMKK